MSDLLALNENPLNPAAMDSNCRVNIRTNRINIKPQKGYLAYDLGTLFDMGEEGPYIWSTPEQFEEFCEINSLDTSSLNKNIKSNDNKNVKKKQYVDDNEDDDKKYGIMVEKLTNKTLPVRNLNQKNNIVAGIDLSNVFIKDCHDVCKQNDVDKPTFKPTSKDPRDLPESAIHSLCGFHINGLEGWAVVADVIDGDTIDVVMYVPLKALANGHEYKYYSKRGVRSFLHTQNLDAGFFPKIRCRFDGCDAMEKNTPEGMFARALTVDLYQRLNGHVWIKFVTGKNIEKSDKYGRNLVRVFNSEKLEIEYTRYLFNFNSEKEGIKIVEEYDGGTKSEYAKKLDQREEDETQKIMELLSTKLEQIIINNRKQFINNIKKEISVVDEKTGIHIEVPQNNELTNNNNEKPKNRRNNSVRIETVKSKGDTGKQTCIIL